MWAFPKRNRQLGDAVPTVICSTNVREIVVCRERCYSKSLQIYVEDAHAFKAGLV